jgi:hypothetical protein
MEMAIQSHRDLKVWQKAMDLCVEIYRLTNKFPLPSGVGWHLEVGLLPFRYSSSSSTAEGLWAATILSAIICGTTS